MIVFDTGRPIRSEAVFESDTHSATPAGRACRGEFKAGKRVKYTKTIARYCRAALQIDQCRVPGITDLAGEKADAISFYASRERRIENADARAAQIRPITLSFHAENELICLPAVADLATGDASGAIGATVRNERAGYRNDAPAIAALTPAAITADVETRPIVHRGDVRHRRCLNSHISGRRGGGHAHQCYQTDRSQQKLLHRMFSIPVASG